MADGTFITTNLNTSSTALDRARGVQRLERQLQLALQQEVRRMASRDREVRAHEQAHAAVGGRYTGAPRYEHERGPNGVAYAVSGSVKIDVSPVPNDPAATLEKMNVVQRAALAPTRPSAADRAIAAKATAQAAQARAELAAARSGDSSPAVVAERPADARAPGTARDNLVVDTRGGAIDTSA